MRVLAGVIMLLVAVAMLVYMWVILIDLAVTAGVLGLVFSLWLASNILFIVVRQLYAE